MKRLGTFAVIIAVFAFAVFFRVQSIKSGQQDRREGIEQINEREGFPVILTDVEQGQFEVWQDIPGKVEGAQQAFITTPDVARVASIEYKLGDFVPADTPVIRLDKEDPQNMTKAALLRKVYNDALKDYRSFERLYKKGGVSKNELDKMRLNYESAKTNLNSALSTVDLSSPVSGILISLYAREGERPKPNKTLAIISNLEQAKVVAKISDRDAQDIKLDQAVRVRTASGEYIEGSVDRISLGANPDSGLFDLDMIVENQDQVLKSGVYVTAGVRIFYQDRAIYTDSRSVLRDLDGSYFVYQVKDGVARKVTVDIIQVNDEYSLVEGLNPDLPVVLRGKSLLKDGAKVRLVAAGESR